MNQDTRVAADAASKRSGLKSFLYFLKLLVGNFLLFAVLIELVCVIYINVTDWHSSKPTSKPRTVVLGDSMMEGLGLADQDRLTNILEKGTGREYLNFGTSGDFGPLQYALLYKTLAAKFDHDTVVVGVLPDNDFHDMSLEWGKVHHADRYRPYYADDFSIVYTNHVKPRAGEGLWDRI